MKNINLYSVRNKKFYIENNKILVLTAISDNKILKQFRDKLNSLPRENIIIN